MAKQRTGRIPWQCLGNVWIAGLTWTLTAALCPGKAMGAAEGGAGSSPSLSATSAALEYQETEYSVNNWAVSLGTQSKPFQKEPAGLSGKIVRGTLNFSGDSSNSIPFLWARDARKLYLDLNGSQDLTADPAGVFTAEAPAAGNFENFKHVHLVLKTPFGKCRTQVNLNFYDYGQASGPVCTIEQHSFWQGKMSLGGRDWQVGIVLNGQAPAGALSNGQLLLRPWENRNQPFSVTDQLLASVPLTRKVFWDGQAYQVEWSGPAENGEARPVLQFTEQTAALGDLKITGQYIGRLVLTGGPWLVVLDEPAGTVKVPTGSYIQVEVRLEKGGTLAYRNAGAGQIGRQIAVDDKTPAVLNVGGPLTNIVAANRHGQELAMSYQVVGAGGEVYQMPGQDRSKPPKFAVYSGEKKMASGEFEYG